MMQPKMPLGRGLLYECANPKCFYCEALMTFDEVVWIHYYNHELEDLDLRATCPACGDPLMIWRDEDDTVL